MNNSSLDADDCLHEMCGNVFSTRKGKILFSCALCEEKYLCCENFLLHLSKNHVIREELKQTNTSNYGKPNILKEVDKSYQEYSEIDPLILNSPGVHYDEGIAEQETVDEYIECQRDPHSKSRLRTQNPTKKSMRLEVDIHDGETSQHATNGSKVKEECETTSIESNEKAKFCFKTRYHGKADSDRVSKSKVIKSKNRKKQKDEKSNGSSPKQDSETAKREQLIRCLNCPAIYSDVQEFRSHMKEHDNYICPKCSAGYRSQRTFDQHTDSVNANIDCALVKRPFQCNYCGFAFTLKSKLNVHLRFHFDEGNHQCSKCTKKFKSLLRLKYHLRTHIKEKPFKCHICGATMSSDTNMKVHIFRHSEENKKFECKDCSKNFFSRMELDVHTRAIHTKNRPYLCPDCGISFPVLSYFTRHKRIRHTARERSVKCEFCPQAFFDQPGLRRHLLIHADERNHVCSTCNAAFKARSTLVTHLKIHENKRSYKCDLCQKGFNQGAALSSHMKNVHNNNL